MTTARTLGFLAIGAAGAVGLYLLKDILFPTNHHDEPIIIENGPVRFYFNPRRNSSVAGKLDSNEYQFVRRPSYPIKAARFWKNEAAVQCGTDTAICHSPYVWKVTNPVVIALKNGHGINLGTDGNGIALSTGNAQSHKKLKSRGKGPANRFTLELDDKDTAHLISSVKIGANVTVYPRSANPSQPEDPNDTTPIRIQFCSNMDSDHCPEFQDWP